MNNLDFLFIDNERGYKFTKRWINLHHNEIIIAVDDFSKKNGLTELPFKIQLWHLINNEVAPPKCYCGNELKFISNTIGYTLYCSPKCAANSPQTKEKYKITCKSKYGKDNFTQTSDYKEKTLNTNLNKYGVEHSAQSEDVKMLIKETNLNKYGVENVFSSKIIKDKIRNTKKERYGNVGFNNAEKISESLKNKYTDLDELNKFLKKQKKTNILRYGNEYANQNSVIRDKNVVNAKKSIEKKYGVDNVFKLKSVQDKIFLKNYSLFQQRYPDLIFNSHHGTLHEIKCPKCGIFTITSSLLYSRYSDKHEICTNCHPVNDSVSILENTLFDFLSGIYSGVIIKNNRKILNGQELDIFIPEHNLAIEFDGLYWHSELYKDNNYHLNKTLECEKKGVRLIHIFEDEWTYKQDIVKSRLKNILGLTENRIYARKCKIMNVSSSDTKKFLNNNHLQGSTKSTIKLGLYHSNELISMMCFLKQSNQIFNLTRFVSKLDTNVIGGADKLLKHFIKLYNPCQIITFSDVRWGYGDLYKKLNFKELPGIQPSYWYVIGNNRFHKFNFRKNRKSMKYFDKSKTEHEIMLNRKIFRIYDCGLKKWSLKISNYAENS